MDLASAKEIAMLKAERAVAMMRHAARSAAVPRRIVRAVRRDARHAEYAIAGLNGARAVARRRRQRETGHSCQAQGYIA